MGKVFAVGVGPGSPKYVTEIVKDIVQNCDIVISPRFVSKITMGSENVSANTKFPKPIKNNEATIIRKI